MPRMPELRFTLLNVGPAKYAAVPTLLFRLGVQQLGEPVAIRSVSLQCQLRIDARKRRYSSDEQQRLTDLFGTPERWSHTVSSFLWTQVQLLVPAFQGATETELTVPVSFDFALAATKYFYGLQHGELPLLLLFSGNVFYADADGALAMDAIAWDREIQAHIPLTVWHALRDLYYPNLAWLSLKRETFEALDAYKRSLGVTGYDEALTRLLSEEAPAATLDG
jgi:hypothetical protein